MSTVPTINKAIANTKIIKDLRMISGTQKIPNFFVIFEDDLIEVGLKLIEDVSSSGNIYMRVRMQTKADSIADMSKLYSKTYEANIDSAICEFVKCDSNRVSFLLNTGVEIKNPDELNKLQVSDLVDGVLGNAVLVFNKLFNMDLTRKGFEPTLAEIIQVSLPSGYKELTEDKDAPKEPTESATVTPIK